VKKKREPERKGGLHRLILPKTPDEARLKGTGERFSKKGGDPGSDAPRRQKLGGKRFKKNLLRKKEKGISKATRTRAPEKKLDLLTVDGNRQKGRDTAQDPLWGVGG